MSRRETSRRRSRGGSALDALSGCADLDGLMMFVALVLFVLFGWLVAELVIPAVLFGAYVLLMAALRRVANDDHRCERHLGRAAFWGILWATVYTLPLAALVWLAHRVLQRG